MHILQGTLPTYLNIHTYLQSIFASYLNIHAYWQSILATYLNIHAYSQGIFATYLNIHTYLQGVFATYLNIHTYLQGILKIRKSMNLMSNRLVLKFLLWPPTVVTCFYYSYKMIINCIVHYREWCRICWNKYYLILLFMINVFLILIVGTRAASVHWRDCVLLYLSQARYGGLSINWPSFSHIHCYISCYYHFCCLYFPAMSLYRWVTPFD